MISKFITSIVPTASVLLLIFWGTGQVLKDISWLSGLLFYIPSPILAGLYLLLTLVAWRRRRSRRRNLYAVLMLPPLLFVFAVENHWGTARPTAKLGSPLRLVHWNLCHTVMGWPQQRETIRSLKPDVLVLSEISDVITDKDFPGFQTLRIHGMLIACRGKMSASGSLVAGGAIRAFHVHCQLDGGPLDVLIADMTSNLYVSRDLYLQPFVRVISERQVDLAVGDLNAPRRSRALSSLASGYRHANDEAGSGWSYTWPVPAPVYAIDQCICGPQVQPLKYQLFSTMLSDHRIQVLDFEKRYGDAER